MSATRPSPSHKSKDIILRVWLPVRRPRHVFNTLTAPPEVHRVAWIERFAAGNAGGDDLGDIERAVMGKDNQPSIVIGNGGFLGLGEKRVAIPLQQTAMRGDQLIIQGLTDDQIRAMLS